MATYRAAYLLTTPQGIGFRLTGPEHADLSAEALRAEARAEALRADLVDLTAEDPEAAHPRLTAAAFAQALTIGNWTE